MQPQAVPLREGVEARGVEALMDDWLGGKWSPWPVLAAVMVGPRLWAARAEPARLMSIAIGVAALFHLARP